MTDLKQHAVGRLAMRQEGKIWQAYWADQDTVQGAIPIANILISLVSTEESKQAFIECLTRCLQPKIEDSVGASVKEWNIQSDD